MELFINFLSHYPLLCFKILNVVDDTILNKYFTQMNMNLITVKILFQHDVNIFPIDIGSTLCGNW